MFMTFQLRLQQQEKCGNSDDVIEVVELIYLEPAADTAKLFISLGKGPIDAEICEATKYLESQLMGAGNNPNMTKHCSL